MDSIVERIIKHEGERLAVYDDATGLPIIKGETLTLLCQVQ